MERKVVVVGPITVWSRDEGEMFAARFEPLKLTSYGRTEEEAKRAVREHFKRFIRQNRKIGALETVLNKVEAKWYWEDEYPADSGLPIEYVDDPAEFHDPVEPADSAPKTIGGYTQIGREWAIAA